MFKQVDLKINFPEMEKRILDEWYVSGLVDKYLHKNDLSKKRFSFMDGPITANNPMGVHHAWGRTYKDLWQRFKNMQGYKERFQNGFDCQGLWVEVEVEKDLGFKTKKDIEVYGIANFVNKCKERVLKYSTIQTEQSKRLGYFMDWDNSYFTMSDENNYTIWHFLKICYERGWIYKGHDSVPWCPRCETAISQHEMLTEDYKEIIHDSIIMEFPLIEHEDEYLLVWTTTPWTIPANIAVAVDQKADYSLVEGGNDPKNKFWVATPLIESVFGKEHGKIISTVKGESLVGLHYRSAFDGLETVEKARKENPEKFHSIVATDNLLMLISMEEGTGMVHTAVSAGEEDFHLGKKLGLPMIPVIADNADYLPGFGDFSGKNAKKHPEVILDYIKERDSKENCWVFKIFPYKHRYPACWRCKTELVWKVADEWYIAMDKPSNSKLKTQNSKTSVDGTLREQLIEVTKKIKWLPEFGLDRELDWLKNMHDWLISKKNRYWGLALPIYECQKCGHFEVVGGMDELKSLAVEGWDKFEGNTPHKPWIDEVKIRCSKCQDVVSRIPDVGNPWLDAGIVSYSTLHYLEDKKYWKEWFPADFITESFPGQFKNWFYALITMSTVLENTNPTNTILGFATMVDSLGRPFHKSAGNAIEFVDAADRFGADVIRWYCTSSNPYENPRFGQKEADETRRKFHLTLWNVYNFFITYANLSKWEAGNRSVSGGAGPGESKVKNNVLDKWILAKLDQLTLLVTDSLEKYDAYTASTSIGKFVEDLSTWYIRRSRDRMTPEFFETTYEVLVTLCKLLAPFTPYLAEEMYRNLTGEESVHLANWPIVTSTSSLVTSKKLTEGMESVRKIVELGHAKRKEAEIKVRQPLGKISIFNLPAGGPDFKFLNGEYEDDLIQLIKDELNVKEVEFSENTEDLENKGDLVVELDTNLTPELIAEGEAREIVRQIQDARKEAGTALDETVIVYLPIWPTNFEDYIKKQTLAKELRKANQLRIER